LIPNAKKPRRFHKMYIPCASILFDLLPFLDGILPLRATCTFYLEHWMEYKAHKYDHDFQLIYPSRSMIRIDQCMFCLRCTSKSKSYCIRFGSYPRGVFVYCPGCTYPFVLNYKKYMEQSSKQVVVNTILPTPCQVPRSNGGTSEGWAMRGYLTRKNGVACAWEEKGGYFEKYVPLRQMLAQLIEPPRYMKYL